jgi:hypothetical protein
MKIQDAEIPGFHSVNSRAALPCVCPRLVAYQPMNPEDNDHVSLGYFLHKVALELDKRHLVVGGAFVGLPASID